MTSNQHNHEDGSIGCCHGSHGVEQSLDELDFERGIWSAALNDEYERVQKLLKYTDVDKRDNNGYTALHYASRSGHLSVCSLLLQNGAEPNAKTWAGGVTPLHRSAYCGHQDVVRELLNYKADPLNVDEDGKSPLHKAAEKGHLEICRILLQTEPSLIVIADNKGRIALDYASKDDVKKLLQEH